jgi:NADH-quinone oxidoreductase subunit C
MESSKISELIEQHSAKNVWSIQHYDIKGVMAYTCIAKDANQILNFLKTNDELRFTILTDLFAVDYLEDAKRFEMVYNLLSLKLNQRLVIKTKIAENESIESATNIFSAAGWYEREAFDMYGIKFDNLLDHRRILTDYGFKGHPMRKDFPVTGHVEVKYDKDIKKVIYEPVVLEQEFRNFDFVSPWRGHESDNSVVLPGYEKATE